MATDLTTSFSCVSSWWQDSQLGKVEKKGAADRSTNWLLPQPGTAATGTLLVSGGTSGLTGGLLVSLQHLRPPQPFTYGNQAKTWSSLWGDENMDGSLLWYSGHGVIQLPKCSSPHRVFNLFKRRKPFTPRKLNLLISILHLFHLTVYQTTGVCSIPVQRLDPIKFLSWEISHDDDVFSRKWWLSVTGEYITFTDNWKSWV